MNNEEGTFRLKECGIVAKNLIVESNYKHNVFTENVDITLKNNLVYNQINSIFSNKDKISCSELKFISNRIFNSVFYIDNLKIKNIYIKSYISNTDYIFNGTNDNDTSNRCVIYCEESSGKINLYTQNIKHFHVLFENCNDKLDVYANNIYTSKNTILFTYNESKGCKMLTVGDNLILTVNGNSDMSYLHHIKSVEDLDNPDLYQDELFIYGNV